MGKQLIISGNEVLETVEMNTGKQIVLIKQHYCLYLKSILVHDADNANVTARIYNYLNEPQIDFNDIIKFECDGVLIEIQATNGVAEITVEVLVGESVIIRTVNENMGNGEVVING